MLLHFYTPFFVAIAALLFVKKKRILFDDVFWLFFWWLLVIGTAVTSGIYWGYPITIQCFLYIFGCMSLYLLGRKQGLISKKKNIETVDIEPSSALFRKFTFLGIGGVIIFSFDFIRLNGLLVEKSSYNISLLGSIGMLLIPLLLVVGLYKFGYYYYQGKIDYLALLFVMLYTIPGYLNSGRESFVYVLIGLISLKAFVDFKTGRPFISISLTKGFFPTLIIGVIVYVVVDYMLNTTATRFTDNEINVFVYKNNVPSSIIEEGESLGIFSSIYFSILSYFGHQIAFLSAVLNDYHGPYLLGMFELNIVSRRLPDFLNLDYNLGASALRKLAGGRFSGEWPTILGVLIVDFGKIPVLIICYYLGVVVGRCRRMIIGNNSIAAATLISLICLSITTTIQLGPFYNTSIYGTYLWWYYIFHRKKTSY